MPWKVMDSIVSERRSGSSKRKPDRFDAIVSEGVVAEPELANRDGAASLVTL
jgi:hypothetical protein